MPEYRAIRLDEHPNDVIIPGRFVRKFREARGSVTEREKVNAEFTRYLTERMEGEQRNWFSKLIRNKWTKRAALLGAGALAVASGSILVGGVPDWLSTAWNFVGKTSSSVASTAGAVGSRVTGVVGAVPLGPLGTVGSLVAPIGSGIVSGAASIVGSTASGAAKFVNAIPEEYRGLAAGLGVAGTGLGIGLLARRVIKGSRAAIYERDSDLRILQSEIESINNGYVRFERKTH